METGGVVRTPGNHGACGANVPAIHQPNPGQRYMRTFRQDGDDPPEEFVNMADFGQFQ
jgi:hypothetical protein